MQADVWALRMAGYENLLCESAVQAWSSDAFSQGMELYRGVITLVLLGVFSKKQL